MSCCCCRNLKTGRVSLLRERQWRILTGVQHTAQCLPVSQRPGLSCGTSAIACESLLLLLLFLSSLYPFFYSILSPSFPSSFFFWYSISCKLDPQMILRQVNCQCVADASIQANIMLMPKLLKLLIRHHQPVFTCV